MQLERVRVVTISLFMLLASSIAGALTHIAAGESATSQTFYQGATLLWILGFFFHWSQLLLNTPITEANRSQWIHLAKINVAIVGAIAMFLVVSLIAINQFANGVLPIIATGVFLVILFFAAVCLLLWLFTLLHDEISTLGSET